MLICTVQRVIVGNGETPKQPPADLPALAERIAKLENTERIHYQWLNEDRNRAHQQEQRIDALESAVLEIGRMLREDEPQGDGASEKTPGVFGVSLAEYVSGFSPEQYHMLQARGARNINPAAKDDSQLQKNSAQNKEADERHCNNCAFFEEPENGWGYCGPCRTGGTVNAMAVCNSWKMQVPPDEPPQPEPRCSLTALRRAFVGATASRERGG